MWINELAGVSNDFVYCPFRMGSLEERRFGCVIGKDYAAPIVKMKNEWRPESRGKVNKFAARQAGSARK